MITFNKVNVQGKEFNYMKDAMGEGVISGDGKFSRKCNSLFWINSRL